MAKVVSQGSSAWQQEYCLVAVQSKDKGYEHTHQRLSVACRNVIQSRTLLGPTAIRSQHLVLLNNLRTKCDIAGGLLCQHWAWGRKGPCYATLIALRLACQICSVKVFSVVAVNKLATLLKLTTHFDKHKKNNLSSKILSRIFLKRAG